MKRKHGSTTFLLLPEHGTAAISISSPRPIIAKCLQRLCMSQGPSNFASFLRSRFKSPPLRRWALADCTATNIIEGLRQNEVVLIRRRSPRVACNDAGLDQPFRNIGLEEGEQINEHLLWFSSQATECRIVLAPRQIDRLRKLRYLASAATWRVSTADLLMPNIGLSRVVSKPAWSSFFWVSYISAETCFRASCPLIKTGRQIIQASIWHILNLREPSRVEDRIGNTNTSNAYFVVRLPINNHQSHQTMRTHASLVP